MLVDPMTGLIYFEHPSFKIKELMNTAQFIDLVASMRNAQKEYFKTRSATSLQKSKELEAQVNQEIQRQLNHSLF